MATKSGNEFITKKYLDKKLEDFADAILAGMDHIIKNMATKDDIKRLEIRLDKLEIRLTKLETEISHLKDEIKGLKAELSNTPSRAEFEDLKSRTQILEKKFLN